MQNTPQLQYKRQKLFTVIIEFHPNICCISSLLQVQKRKRRAGYDRQKQAKLLSKKEKERIKAKVDNAFLEEVTSFVVIFIATVVFDTEVSLCLCMESNRIHS